MYSPVFLLNALRNPQSGILLFETRSSRKRRLQGNILARNRLFLGGGENAIARDRQLQADNQGLKRKGHLRSHVGRTAGYCQMLVV